MCYHLGERIAQVQGYWTSVIWMQVVAYLAQVLYITNMEISPISEINTATHIYMLQSVCVEKHIEIV